MGGETAQSAIILDLSRLISRVGRARHTGIDRVEFAYLSKLLTLDRPIFGLVRSSFGFTLFDRTGLAALADRLAGRTDWAAPDTLARLFLKAHPEKRGAETDLRRLALGRSGRRTLAALIADHVPKGAVYLNVGHSNIRASVFDAIQRIGGRSVVLVHDTIPLDHPDWQREGTVESFEARMKQVSAKADLVIHTAQATRHVTEAQFAEMGRVPPGLVAPLGIDVATPSVSDIPAGLGLNRPYFVALGTIEPRKNHALLLDVWSDLSAKSGSEVPMLYVVGSRGWKNDAVFERLDAHPAHVRELGALSDGAVAALLTNARALLMPSLVEGFGLPPGEALALGCPVIASDLPVYREVFGNNIVYLDPTDRYSWATEITNLALQNRRQTTVPDELPTWDDHFNQVLKAL